jgi:hypothetical protein
VNQSEYLFSKASAHWTLNILTIIQRPDTL